MARKTRNKKDKKDADGKDQAPLPLGNGAVINIAEEPQDRQAKEEKQAELQDREEVPDKDKKDKGQKGGGVRGKSVVAKARETNVQIAIRKKTLEKPADDSGSDGSSAKK